MSVLHIILSSWPSVCQNYQIWWRFDEVLIKTSETSFLDHAVVILIQTADCCRRRRLAKFKFM